MDNPAAADIDLDDLLAQILDVRRYVTPAGTRIFGYRWGRVTVILEADRSDGNPFTEEIEQVAGPITRTLALVAMWRRTGNDPVLTSPWGRMGEFHAPRGCAAELLGVMLALDAGDLEPARRIAETVADGDTQLQSTPVWGGRGKVAVEIAARLESDIPAALAAP